MKRGDRVRVRDDPRIWKVFTIKDDLVLVWIPAEAEQWVPIDQIFPVSG